MAGRALSSMPYFHHLLESITGAIPATMFAGNTRPVQAGIRPDEHQPSVRHNPACAAFVSSQPAQKNPQVADRDI
jgi:hypothetical protein